VEKLAGWGRGAGRVPAGGAAKRVMSPSVTLLMSPSVTSEKGYELLMIMSPSVSS